MPARTAFKARPAAHFTLIWLLALNAPLLALLGLARVADIPEPSPLFGVQMHLHGSLSEGPGSMAGHNHMARQLNGAVDVIWWTDHDWRIAAYTYISQFDFENSLVVFGKAPAAKKGEDSVRQSWDRQQVTRPLTAFETTFTAQQARLGAQSLRLQAAAAAGADWQQQRYLFRTDRNREIASLAMGVKLKLSIFPEAFGPDARVILSVLLSQQPPSSRGRIDYVIHAEGAGEVASPAEASLPLMVDELPLRIAPVGVVARVGQWNDFEFDLTADADRLELGGVDNSACEITLAVEARNAARLVAHVDAFGIDRRVTGAELFERQKQMARQFGDAPVNYVGQEISYASHTNAYGASVPLSDLRDNANGHSHESAVRFVHAHGGIVSLNHVFGPGGLAGMRDHRQAPESKRFDYICKELRERRCHGADLLEVGYIERYFGLAAFTELWDGLSADQTYVTGIGVSDSHSNAVGWMQGPNNWITWVYAKSIVESDLIDGLRAGRAFCGDPMRFDGRLDISTPEGFQMGQVVVTQRDSQLVTVAVQGGRSGQKVRVYVDGKGRSEHEVTAAPFEHAFTLDTLGPTFVRFELVDPRGVVALSNPLYFTRRVPASGIPAARRVDAP